MGKTWNLTIDALKFTIGCELSQDGYPAYFYSRALHESEKNYSIIEIELFAIVSSVKKLKHYLYGSSIIVFTDHKPLIWLST